MLLLLTPTVLTLGPGPLFSWALFSCNLPIIITFHSKEMEAQRREGICQLTGGRARCLAQGRVPLLPFCFKWTQITLHLCSHLRPVWPPSATLPLRSWFEANPSIPSPPGPLPNSGRKVQGRLLPGLWEAGRESGTSSPRTSLLLPRVLSSGRVSNSSFLRGVI